MKTRLRRLSVLFLILISMVSAVPAMAANGTLKVAFRYINPDTGLDQALIYGYIYLHDAAKPAPMERFFTKADYILGPSTYLDGNYSVQVPAGRYYVRILQRRVVTGTPRPYGPPEAGDLTWFQTTPITITAGVTLDLGTRYATTFKSSPVTITGTIRSSSGTPLEGRYVRAQTEPCLVPINCTDTGCDQYGNKCGPNKFPALRATDVEGKYTLLLADPGTYYIYTSPCLLAGHNQNDNTRCPYTAAPAPVTVMTGENVTVDIVVN